MIGVRIYLLQYTKLHYYVQLNHYIFFNNIIDKSD